MASTPQPVSIPVSLTVIGLIWATENLRVEPGKTLRQNQEVTKHADSHTARTDLVNRPSTLESSKSVIADQQAQ